MSEKIYELISKAHHKTISIEAIKTAKRLHKFKIPGSINGKATDVPVKIEMTIFF